MQFHPERLPSDEDRITIPDLTVHGTAIAVDTRSIREAFRDLVLRLNRMFAKVQTVVVSNEASSLIIEPGLSLPAAEEYYNGRFATTQKSGGSGEDELWWCKWNGSAWAWEKII